MVARAGKEKEMNEKKENGEEKRKKTSMKNTFGSSHENAP